MTTPITPLLSKIQLSKTTYDLLKTGSVGKITFHRNQATLAITLKLATSLPFQNWQELTEQLSDYFSVNQLALNLEIENCRYPYLTEYVTHYYKQTASKLGLSQPLVQVSGQQINCRWLDEASLNLAEENTRSLEEFLQQAGFLTFSLNFEIYRDTFDYHEVKVKLSEPPANLTPTLPVHQRKRPYLPIKDLSLITEEIDKIVVVGKIFKLDKVENRTNQRLIVTAYIFDEHSALILKYFEGRRFSREMLEALTLGQSLQAYGNVEYDRFARDLVLKVEKFEIIADLFAQTDQAIKKRVELHAHTNKSEMDGIPSATALVEYAFQLGHPAVAITDHNVVQAFPEAQRAAQKLLKQYPDREFKVIYGVEFNLINDDLKIVFNSSEQVLPTEYIVLDLETTGLSNRYDEIIEFGAVKLENGLVTAQKQFYLNPQRELSHFILQKTGITQEQVDSAAFLAEKIDEIREFIGNYPVVAHNATFDWGFLQAAMEKTERSALTNPVIDTLNLSRTIHSTRRNHALGYVARFYGITYDESSAHRADYDAEVLTNVFLNLLEEAKKLGCKTYDDLNQLMTTSTLLKTMPSHVIALAKNPAGIKALYELVTLAHTTYLATTAKIDDSNEITSATPVLTKSVLNQYRQDLLIGSACFNGEVFETAMNKDQRALEKCLAFYDYIEIQPLTNYQPLIVKQQIPNQARLISILQAIIKSAVKQNKLVVASSDSHYLGPEDKVLRDVFIMAQGVGGTRHPLYYREERLRQSTAAPDQHFRNTEEMLLAYDYLAPEIAYELVVSNTNQIASQIEVNQPIKDKLYTPTITDADQKLAEICYANAFKLYGKPLPAIVAKRLTLELEKITTHGFGVIYYIAHLLVKHSLDHGYIVGSRGSVGSSLVATMANITEVNPLPPHYYCPKCHYQRFYLENEVASGYDLPSENCPNCQTPLVGEGQDIPFETFLGFEGDKVPDIDLNFSSEFQEQAHDFTKTIFGEQNVFRAGTIGTVAVKSAFGYVLNYVEELDLPPLKEALRVRLAEGCSGVKRTTGQHPGGIIVVPAEMSVSDFTPVQYPANNPQNDWLTTHFEFADIHDNLLKLDILGHVDPTAMKLLERISGVDVRSIPMNDPQVMALFNSLDSLHLDSRTYGEKTGAIGLPEFGTNFVRSILELTKPTSFSELVRISGLSHGTDVWLNNAKPLIEQGQSLNHVIGCRDDIMVDLIKQGLKPKDAFDIMESVRKGRGLTPQWITLMQKHQVSDWYIESCQRIKYMFPKAHAVAYVIMALRVAWFKVYYPAYYYISFFSLRADAYDIEAFIGGKLAIENRLNDINNRLNEAKNNGNDVTQKERDLLITLEVALEMHLRGYRFSNLDLNRSLATEFTLDERDEKVLIPPFITIDGLGANAARSIVSARNELPFISKEDILKRTLLSTTLINRLEQLQVLKHLQDENQLALF